MSTRQEGPAVGVLTVDDQAVFRAAARDVIEATPGFVVVGEAASGDEALQIVEALRPDLVLVDMRMPGMDGFETVRRLAAAHPRAVVVLVSLEGTSDVALRARSAGAATFVRKHDVCPSMLTRLWTTHRKR